MKDLLERHNRDRGWCRRGLGHSLGGCRSGCFTTGRQRTGKRVGHVLRRMERRAMPHEGKGFAANLRANQGKRDGGGDEKEARY